MDGELIHHPGGSGDGSCVQLASQICLLNAIISIGVEINECRLNEASVHVLEEMESVVSILFIGIINYTANEIKAECYVEMTDE